MTDGEIEKLIDDGVKALEERVRRAIGTGGPALRPVMFLSSRLTGHGVRYSADNGCPKSVLEVGVTAIIEAAYERATPCEACGELVVGPCLEH